MDKLLPIFSFIDSKIVFTFILFEQIAKFYQALLKYALIDICLLYHIFWFKVL